MTLYFPHHILALPQQSSGIHKVWQKNGSFQDFGSEITECEGWNLFTLSRTEAYRGVGGTEKVRSFQ